MNEYYRTYHTYTSRRNDYKPLGAREKFTFAINSTGTNNSISSKGDFQSRYCQTVGYFPSDCPIMERTFLSSQTTRSGKRCSSPRSYSQNKSQESYGYCKCHFIHNASRRDSLERTQHGQDPESKQRQCPTHLET